jgi:hypothetical protein
MVVATQPYGNTDFEYPEVVLTPFKASSVSIIPQSEVKKAFEEKENEEEQKEDDKIDVKPDSIKPSSLIPQAFVPQKKEPVKTIEVKQERTESDGGQFAPIPLNASPVN